MVSRTGLFRSRTNKMIGGVAAGIAYHLNTDPTLIRILFLMMAVFWGGGVLLYLILWIALPEEDIPLYGQADHKEPQGDPQQPAANEPDHETYRVPRNQNNAALIIGLFFIIIGGAFLFERFFYAFHFRHLWPVLLVVAGLVLIISSFTGSKKM